MRLSIKPVTFVGKPMRLIRRPLMNISYIRFLKDLQMLSL